jgi:hypothetical protein
MDDLLVVRLPQLFVCGTCDPYARIVSDTAHIGLEPLFDDHGELIGLHSVARYPGCGHRMPQVRMDEVDVAGVMDGPGADEVLQIVMLADYEGDDEDEDGGY